MTDEEWIQYIRNMIKKNLTLYDVSYGDQRYKDKINKWRVMLEYNLRKKRRKND